jgi:hypothetical protein
MATPDVDLARILALSEWLYDTAQDRVETINDVVVALAGALGLATATYIDTGHLTPARARMFIADVLRMVQTAAGGSRPAARK